MIENSSSLVEKHTKQWIANLLLDINLARRDQVANVTFVDR